MMSIEIPPRQRPPGPDGSVMNRGHPCRRPAGDTTVLWTHREGVGPPVTSPAVSRPLQDTKGSNMSTTSIKTDQRPTIVDNFATSPDAPTTSNDPEIRSLDLTDNNPNSQAARSLLYPNSQFLPVPSASLKWEDERALERSRSSSHRSQAAKIKPPSIAPGSKLSMAKSFCQACTSQLRDRIGGWKKHFAPSKSRTISKQSAMRTSLRGTVRTDKSSKATGGIVKAANARWTRDRTIEDDVTFDDETTIEDDDDDDTWSFKSAHFTIASDYEA